MSLKAFLHSLQFDPDQVKPPDWEANWADAPLPYKLYRGLPVFPLSADVPLTLGGAETEGNLDNPTGKGKNLLRTIGHLLWYTYGLSQVSQTVVGTDASFDGYEGYSQTSYRRFVPSGGGLYPNELYVYLKAEDLPAGVYHYDVAHHRLVLLREGNWDAYLSKALGGRCDIAACIGVAFAATYFWKNFFKYNNFAYRLQGLDGGVLVGQLLEVSGRFGYESGVCYQFLDAAVNHLLGLQGQEESVYAVIPWTVSGKNVWTSSHSGVEPGEPIAASALCRELPAVQHDHYVRSQTVIPSPKLVELNEAAFLDSKLKFRSIGNERGIKQVGTSRFELPRVERLKYDLAVVCRERQSPESDYVLSEISLEQLSALLQETSLASAYCNDLNETIDPCLPGVSLCGCFYGVQGIPDGAYLYDSPTHSLRLLREGDHRAWLQQGMSLNNISLYQVPLTFHVAGDRENLHTELGCRGYRIQQMEAGLLVQRLLVAAYALGLGGRPLLGFDVNLCDEIYDMAAHGLTSLIQIPIGAYRGRAKLEGRLGN